MQDHTPYRWVKPTAMVHLFIIVLVSTLILIAAMQVLGASLSNETAPNGIITYEFSGNLKTAQAILASWGEEGRITAGLQLGLDYLFMLAYALAIGLGCVLVSPSFASLTPSLQRWGSWLAWGLWAAAGLDALENYALIRLLLGSENAIWPPIAYGSAAVKFGLVVLGLMYVLAGAVLLLRNRFNNTEES